MLWLKFGTNLLALWDGKLQQEDRNTMKRTCRMAPPAHTFHGPGIWAPPEVGLAHQRLYRYSQGVSSKIWLEATCLCLSDLLHDNHLLPSRPSSHHFCPAPEWRPRLPGILFVLLLPLTHATKYSVGVNSGLSHQQHSREGYSGTPCSYPFSAGAGRQKQRTASPSADVRGLMGLPSHHFSR